MAKKNTTMNIGEAPITLNEHPFYGLKLDKDQEAFRDAIWDESKRIVFCNAKSGFVGYMNWFDGDSRVAVCKLTKNYRGWVSQHADDFDFAAMYDKN